MKFRSQYNNTTIRVAQDLSNRYEQTYIEVPPYARNEKGEFINDSPYPALIEGEKVNIQDRIDSFFEDVDLYSILKKVSKTGDLSYLDKKAGFYADLGNMPTNYNDINLYYKNLAMNFKNLPSDVKALIASDEPIEKVIEKINKINSINNQNIKEDSSVVKETVEDVKQE